jgi:hypothetical protein
MEPSAVAEYQPLSFMLEADRFDIHVADSLVAQLQGNFVLHAAAVLLRRVAGRCGFASVQTALRTYLSHAADSRSRELSVPDSIAVEEALSEFNLVQAAIAVQVSLQCPSQNACELLATQPDRHSGRGGLSHSFHNELASGSGAFLGQAQQQQLTSRSDGDKQENGRCMHAAASATAPQHSPQNLVKKPGVPSVGSPTLAPGSVVGGGLDAPPTSATQPLLETWGRESMSTGQQHKPSSTAGQGEPTPAMQHHSGLRARLAGGQRHRAGGGDECRQRRGKRAPKKRGEGDSAIGAAADVLTRSAWMMK